MTNRPETGHGVPILVCEDCGAEGPASEMVQLSSAWICRRCWPKPALPKPALSMQVNVHHAVPSSIYRPDDADYAVLRCGETNSRSADIVLFLSVAQLQAWSSAIAEGLSLFATTIEGEK